MSETGRFAIFLTIFLSLWALMHAYVLWRAGSIALLATAPLRAITILVAVALGASYPLSRILDRSGAELSARALELVGSTWMGVLFLMFASLLAAEVITGGGFLLPRQAPALRGWALIAALVLSAVALAQGLRDPIVRDYEVRLAGLPPERDGVVIVALTDVHLGTLLGTTWFARIVDRVEALRPDLIAVVGDLIDGNARRVEPMLPVLKRLHAPLGVWAVTGNHEFYAGLERSLGLFRAAGLRVLRDQWLEVTPGLVLAGVDDLTARRQFGLADHPVEKALRGRPPGATVLLSHTPWQAQKAAELGAGLMLSGHTHDGQIWPFGALVRFTYPLMGGRYEVGGMPVIVCRGTGTWGPRMRLWRPSEILRITLRSAG